LWHQQYFNETFHCFALEDQAASEAKTIVMKMNPRSGNIMVAPLNDPNKDTFNLEWPVKNSLKGFRWFTKPVLHDGSIIRPYIDSFGSLNIQLAKYPKQGDEKLDHAEISVEQASIPMITCYPLMAHWHPWNKLMISHLSDKD